MMLLLVRGTIWCRLPSSGRDRCIFLCGDDGREMTLPLGTLDRLTADESGRLVVHTWIIYPAMADGGGPMLYGFATARERDVFCQIVGVARVGATVGLAVLGAMPVDEFRALIVAGDPKPLEAIPHVGKKTAARLVLDLKDRIPVAEEDETSVNRRVLLRKALAGLGFEPAAVDRAVRPIVGLDRPMQDLLREALSSLV